jgi:hypothetical protein
MNTDTTPNLKPQTVYTVSTNGRSNLQLMEDGERVCSLKFNAEKICLSKEELMQVLIDYTDQVISLPGHVKSLSYDEIEQFINNLLNQ